MLLIIQQTTKEPLIHHELDENYDYIINQIDTAHPLFDEFVRLEQNDILLTDDVYIIDDRHRYTTAHELAKFINKNINKPTHLKLSQSDLDIIESVLYTDGSTSIFCFEQQLNKRYNSVLIDISIKTSKSFKNFLTKGSYKVRHVYVNIGFYTGIIKKID